MEKPSINLVQVLIDLGYSKSTARPSASKLYKIAMITKELPMDCMVTRSELAVIKKYVVEESGSKFKDSWKALDTDKVAKGEPTVIVKSNIAKINEIILSFSKWLKENKIDADAVELLFETCKQELTTPDKEEEDEEQA